MRDQCVKKGLEYSLVLEVAKEVEREGGTEGGEGRGEKKQDLSHVQRTRRRHSRDRETQRGKEREKPGTEAQEMVNKRRTEL